MDKILQAFGDIAAVLPRMDKLKETFGDSVDFQQVLSLIYSDILEFHRRVYKFFRRKAWHLWFAFDWGLFEHRFKSILIKLSAHCDLLDKEAAALHFLEMKNIRESSQRNDEEFEARRQRRMAQEVFGWLSVAEDIQEERLHKLADERQPGTCNWIVDDDQVFSWIEDEKGDSILWMTGIPGAGKSCLSSLIIEYLQQRDDKIITLYYIFGQSYDKDSCSLVLRTLAIQLVQKNLDLAPLIHQAYLQKGSSLSTPAMKRMLKEVLSTVKASRIVLDGVDQCDKTVQKDLLGSLIQYAGESCKILVSSRETPEIKKLIPQRIHMRLDGKTDEALHLYIQEKVKMLKEFFPMFDPALFQDVEKRLQEKAGGMFLWVYLVSEMLKRQASELDFEDAIGRLPDGLHAAYGLILTRFRELDPVLRDRCFKILFWVCTAYRSISIHEVADGVALKPGQPTLSRKTRSQDINRDIFEICMPIIEKTNSGILDLVHFSAKEYLLDPQSGPFVEVAQAHFSIAFSCVTNLTSVLRVAPRFSGGMTEEDLEDVVVQGGYGLQQYGQQYWAEHVRAYLQKTSSLDDQSKILIRALNEFSKIRKHNEPSSKPILCAGSEGLERLETIPPLHNFIAGWLHFRSQLNEKGPHFESLEAQEQWQLHTDETFLSLIDFRLRLIKERLLTMDPSNLPSHIRKDDFRAFVSRFSFLCRFYNCTHHFKTRRDRDAHEVTHIPSFPCLECDFSERGFRSRKDLEKHVQRYHKSMEDFEIPDNLFAADIRSRTTMNFGPGCSSRCWNEKGRKVLQDSFGQVLDRLKSEIMMAENENGRARPSLADSSRPGTVSMGLKNIQEKINEQQYQSLAEFKDDIRQISNGPDLSGNSAEFKEMESICDQELEKIFADHADFSPKFSTTSRDVNVVGLDINRDYTQMDMALSDDGAESFESSKFFPKRKPYWSSVEEKEFPNLIQRYGRDYAKISDYLKTKTVDDVEQRFLYLVSTGSENLSSLADTADIRLRLQSQVVEPIQGLDSTPHALSLTTDLAHGSSQAFDRYLIQPPGASFPYSIQPDISTGARDNSALIGAVQGPEVAASDGNRKNERKKYKRNPSKRAYCTLCTTHPLGLHSDHTLKKHQRSYHTATRKVWICMDISIDKRFFATCEKCSADKRYPSKLNAAKHLRAAHFSEDTPKETLVRWMKEIEEPNPKYDGNSIPLNTGSDLPKLSQAIEAIEHQDTSKVSSSRAGLIRLSALQNTFEQRSHSSRSQSPMNTSESDEASHDESTNESVLNPNAVNDDFFLPGISFDDILPGSTTPSTQISSDLETDQVTRALIRPDQVPRLYHLDSFRKAACQDQVDALHERLKHEPTGSRAYQEALDSLTHLSRTLRQNLVDWRRQSTGAPTIPVRF